MFGFPWMHNLFGGYNELSKEELYERAKLIITTTFDHQGDPDYCVLEDHSYHNFYKSLPLFDPSQNNNELLLLCCRLKYKNIAKLLLIDMRVNPFDNNTVVDEVFMFIKINKWNDLLELLLNKHQLDLTKRKQVIEKYTQLNEKYKHIS